MTDHGGWRVVECVGELDLASAPALRTEAVRQLAQGHRRLAIDLTLCDFIDSFGLGMIVAVLKRVRTLDGELAVVCPEPRLRRLFTLTSLDAAIAVLATRDELP